MYFSPGLVEQGVAAAISRSQVERRQKLVDAIHQLEPNISEIRKQCEYEIYSKYHVGDRVSGYSFESMSQKEMIEREIENEVNKRISDISNRNAERHQYLMNKLADMDAGL